MLDDDGTNTAGKILIIVFVVGGTEVFPASVFGAYAGIMMCRLHGN